MKTTREIGRKLEDLIVEYFKEIDPKCRRIKGSGSESQKGDVLCKGFRIECKKRNQSNCIIDRKVWNKLCREVNIYKQEIPLLILQNVLNETFCILSIKDFISILKERK